MYDYHYVYEKNNKNSDFLVPGSVKVGAYLVGIWGRNHHRARRQTEVRGCVVAEMRRTPALSSGVSDQQSVGLSPG